MADEQGVAGSGDVSVGDLVVNLDGNGERLAANFNKVLDLLDKLYPAASKLDVVLSGMGSHLDAAKTITEKQIRAPVNRDRGDMQDAHIQAYHEHLETQRQLFSVYQDAHIQEYEKYIKRQQQMQDRAAEIQAKAVSDYEAHLKEHNAAAQRSLQDGLEYDETRIELTEKGLQKELSLLQLYHQRDRAERIRNNQDTETIDRTAALRQAAIQQEIRKQQIADAIKKGTGDDDEGGEHGMSHYMMRRLGFHAGQAVGATGVGNDVTGIMAAMEGLGPLVGGIAVGLTVVATTISGIVERAAQLRAGQIAYNEELEKTSDHWRAIAAAQAPSTELGRLAFSEMQNATAKMRELVLANEEALHQFYAPLSGLTSRLSNSVESAFSPGGTSFDQQQALDERKIAFQRKMARDMQALYQQQTADALLFNANERSFAVERAQISAMLESPMKRRLELENELVSGREALLRKQKEQNDTENAATTADMKTKQETVLSAQTRLTALMANQAARLVLGKGISPEAIEAVKALQVARAEFLQLSKFHTGVSQSTQSDQANALGALDSQAGARRLGLQREQDAQLIAQHNAWVNSYINASEMGYQRDFDLLVTKHQQERAARERAGSDTIALQAATYNEEVAMARQHAEDMKQIYVDESNAKIAATTYGWERRRQIEEANWQEEQRKFYRDNPNNLNELAARQRTHDMNRQTEVSDDRVRLNDEILDMHNRMLVVTRQITASEGEWAQKARELTREHGLNAAELEIYRTTFMALKQAEANAPIIERMKDLNIELLLATHQISQMEAAYRRLKLANPEANDALLKQQAQLEAHVKAIEFAHQELSKIHPVMQLVDYARQLSEAVKAGGLSEENATALLKKKGFDIFGSMDAGTFNSNYTRGQVDVRGINLNGQFSMNDILRDNGKFLQSMDAKLGLMLQRAPLQ